MRSVEVSARKREDAINKALQELGIERHEAHVEILDEGSPGFLGIGVRDVTVRVSTDVPGEGGFPIEADGNRVDAERRDNRGGRAKGPRKGGDKRRQDRDRKNGDRGPRAQQRGRSKDRTSRDRRGKSTRGGRPDRGDQKKSRPAKTARPEASRKPDRPKRPRPERPREEYSRPEPKERPPAKVLTDAHSSEAAALLHEIIANMGIESTVQPVESEQGGLKLAVESPDSALLIGRKGRNLTALQYLINRILNRQEDWQQTQRIVVDVEGYLDRRRDMLEDMAVRLAERAKSSGRRIRVKPLSPQERRIVHLALHDDPDVRTFSVGESNYRSVIIAPVTEEDTGEAEDDRDYGGEYEENGAGTDNGFDETDDETFGEEEENDAGERDEGGEPRAEVPETSENSNRKPDAETNRAEEDPGDKDAGEKDGNGPDDPKRFRPRKAAGRRGAVRKRRGTKPLASVSTEKEKTGSGDANKEDASGDSNES